MKSLVLSSWTLVYVLFLLNPTFLARADGLSDDGGVCGYSTISMFAKYVGEEKEGGYYDTAVVYLSEVQREAYRVVVRDGRLYGAHGFEIDADDSDYMTSDGAASYGIFSMDACGRIYLSYHHFAGEFHHSSFLAGQPVASAGEMLIVDGQLLLLTNSSGHYRPPSALAYQVVEELSAQGVDMSMVLIEMIE